MGLDSRGLTREWFELISNQIVQPPYGLFVASEANPGVFVIDPTSHGNRKLLPLCRFVGRLLAKALFDQFLISVLFSPLSFRQLKGCELYFDDLREVDPETHKSLAAVQGMTRREEIEALSLIFSVLAHRRRGGGRSGTGSGRSGGKDGGGGGSRGGGG